MKFQHVKDN